MNNLNDYDYTLPPELIAAEPLACRDASRLLVVNRAAGTITHATIRDLPQLLSPGDCLVLNDTQVIPARLLGTRAATGGKWEGLFLQANSSGQWRLIGNTRGKLQPGEAISIHPAHESNADVQLTLTLLEKNNDGSWLAEPSLPNDALELLNQFGTVPLPPYIKRELATDLDWQRYQTTYAQHPGAVAAPTAGLHFTPELLQACDTRGIGRTQVTLHVGIGTFRPISTESLDEHQMHSEWCELPAPTAERLNAVRATNKRIVTVGTTSVRTLESSPTATELVPWSGDTDIFIRPPYEFRWVDGLLTNFHLPKSTLFVLVCAFAGTELMREAYQAAIDERYRFFSYGDAMLIL